MNLPSSRVRRVLATATLLIAYGQGALAAQTVSENGVRRTIVATRLAEGESITLDGRLDEPVWSRAVPGGDFIQIDPDNGMPATEQTEVRIAFDANALYLGITCYDSEPDAWIAYQRRRDEGLPSDDKLRWTIDTFLDARSGYFFEMNPLGHMADALLGINGGNRAWDGIWDARARRSEIGWTLEVELPFRTFNFNPNRDTWGINFERTVQRKNEVSIWTGWGRNQGLARLTNAGLVTGVRNVTQGRGLDIKPYGVVTALASPGRGRPAMRGDANAGLDVFYNPTPELRTVFTVNTDFAQTEVDQRQVNLTRYSLFFPERRDFFLDGATFLDFGSDGNRRFGSGVGGSGGGSNDDQVIPFFSRRIGLSAAGAPQKIDFGTKMTGQIGAQDVGFLHVRTGEDEELASEDFVVARVKRRVFQQSYFGALYTRRDPRAAAGRTRQTAGLDFSMATSAFRGSQNLEVNGWFLHATRPDGRGGRTALGGTFDYPNDRWSARYESTQVQEDFDPAVGFIRRRSYRRYAPMVQFAPRPDHHPYIRQVRFNATLDVMTDLRNDLITRDIDATLLGINFHSQDYVAVSATRRRERLDDAFQIAPDITLPLGAVYDFTRYRVFAQTANRRMLAVTARIEAGDFYSGARSQQLINLTLRARPGLIVYVGGEWNSVTLPEGRFTTRLYRLVGETQFSPFVALVNDIQYDTQSAVLGWQARCRWILAPGNDLYVVYTHNWLDEPLLDRFATLDRRLASKILYTYRF
ncbi:MAG: carbohydrate binding family 9 domain-containing protein [Acidobacteria bacterium]|nr:carbohydrate binding family 9 domain-containing protein [Acidobacteriota bacterium]